MRFAPIRYKIPEFVSILLENQALRWQWFKADSNELKCVPYQTDTLLPIEYDPPLDHPVLIRSLGERGIVNKESSSQYPMSADVFSFIALATRASKGDLIMAKISTKHFLAGVVLLLLTIPGWAGLETPRIYSAQWSTSKTMNIGTTQVGPGTYKFEVPENGSTLFVERDGLAVSDVICYWVKLPQKAEQFKVFTDKNQVVRIEFPDSLDAIVVP